jgi:hypothetical protein
MKEFIESVATGADCTPSECVRSLIRQAQVQTPESSGTSRGGSEHRPSSLDPSSETSR